MKNLDRLKESLAKKLSFEDDYTPSIIGSPNGGNNECNNNLNTECRDVVNTELPNSVIKESHNTVNNELKNESTAEKKKKSKCTFYILDSVLEDFNKFYLTLKMSNPKIDRSDLITQAMKDIMEKTITDIERF